MARRGAHIANPSIGLATGERRGVEAPATGQMHHVSLGRIDRHRRSRVALAASHPPHLGELQTDAAFLAALLALVPDDALVADCECAHELAFSDSRPGEEVDRGI